MNTSRVLFFVLVGWWFGLALWVLGFLFKITIIGYPIGEMCESLAHQFWRI